MPGLRPHGGVDRSHGSDLLDTEATTLTGGGYKSTAGLHGVKEALAAAPLLQRLQHEVSPQKVAFCCALCLCFFYLRGCSSTEEQPARLGQPPAVLAPVRALAAREELDYATRKFGGFLAQAVPYMEGSHQQHKNFMQMLPREDCANWAAFFSDRGVFTFALGNGMDKQVWDRAGAQQVCETFSPHVRAIKDVWDFPDEARKARVALNEFFMKETPSAPYEKRRFAVFRRLDAAGKIAEFALVAETTKPDSMQDSIRRSVDGIIDANVKRLDFTDCQAFRRVLPSVMTLHLQELDPNHLDANHELDHQPVDRIIDRCKLEMQHEFADLDMQYAYLDGVFISNAARRAYIFFHKERRWKTMVDVCDEPEALIIDVGGGRYPTVESMWMYNLDIVHIIQLWSWKYGFEHGEILKEYQAAQDALRAKASAQAPAQPGMPVVPPGPSQIGVVTPEVLPTVQR